MYPRYLSKCVVGLAFRALRRIYDVKDAFFIGPYSSVLFTAITKPCLTKKVFTLVKAHANMNLKTGFDRNFLREYNIRHLILDLPYGDVLLLFGPCLGANLDFVKAFEVLRLPIGTKNLIYAEASKFDIFLRYETYWIESLLVGNVT